ncbi:MAG: MBL fold metallo-hydrolase [Oscillospiraceae bacterium]
MQLKTLQVSPIGTNCYILTDETANTCCVIDPGGDSAQIAKAVGATPLACILLTHGHYDHSGGVKELQALFPEVPVYLSPADIPDPADPRACFLFPAIDGNVHAYGEGDTVTVGSLHLQVLATPGHSRGSVTLLCGEAMFCGDTLFAGSCGRTDLTGGDPNAMLASLGRLGRLEGNYTVYPGHMEASTLDCERAVNPYMRQALAAQ